MQRRWALWGRALLNGANQSLPKSERCLDIYHIQTDLELVRPGHNVKFNYSNSLADGIFECSDCHRLSLHISMPQPQGLYTAQRAFKPLPLSINTAGTIWARQDTKIESGCVCYVFVLNWSDKVGKEGDAVYLYWVR